MFKTKADSGWKADESEYERDIGANPKFPL